MAEGFEFVAEVRKQLGTSNSRRLRREHRVPATVYGAGKDPEAVSLVHKDVAKALENEAVFSHILDLTVDGKKQKVVIKALQRHHTKPKIEHVDFLRVKASEAITMNVPIHLLGEEECAGVKEGGVLSRLMTELSIKCLPADLPEALELDITALELNASLHITDIKLPKGVELAQELDPEQDHPVISIHIPKEEPAEEELEAEAAEGEEGVEAAEGETAEGDKAEGGEDKPADDKKEGSDSAE